jgi:hypothetical protein
MSRSSRWRSSKLGMVVWLIFGMVAAQVGIFWCRLNFMVWCELNVVVRYEVSSQRQPKVVHSASLRHWLCYTITSVTLEPRSSLYGPRFFPPSSYQPSRGFFCLCNGGRPGAGLWGRCIAPCALYSSLGRRLARRCSLPFMAVQVGLENASHR